MARTNLMNDLCIEIANLRRKQEMGEELEKCIRDKFANKLGYSYNESIIDEGDSRLKKVVYQNFEVDKLFLEKDFLQEKV